MTKISIVLFYWIAVAAALLFAKTAGLADNDMAIIKILVVVSILYVGIVLAVHSKGKSQAEKQGRGTSKNPVNTSGKKKKKK